ncbi:hypothetical protein GGS21DRAFT_488126 [Xylaria nigripes]|nr:hypothetical protein GGS21DRAFT_488126 [Xylaria nigripes]
MRRVGAFALTVLAGFLGIAQADVDASLTPTNDYPSNSSSPSLLEEYNSLNQTPNQAPSELPEDYDDDDDDNDEDDEDGDDDDENDNAIINPNKRPDKKPKKFRVKAVFCLGYDAGSNVTDAKLRLLDWGRSHMVGRRNWFWANGGHTFDDQAIVWMCNCHFSRELHVRCREIEESLRALDMTCGPNQAGIVVGNNKKEYGLGSLLALEHLLLANRYGSFCHRKDCCIESQEDMQVAQCGRRHPPNYQLGTSDCPA